MASTSVPKKLREIPNSEHFFCKPTWKEQRTQPVLDQNAEYGKRKIPEHETLTAALQELAAKHGHGFFFYLPTRSSLTSASSEDRIPPERQTPRVISADYPDMLYADYSWTLGDQQKFLETSHRGRYLKSGFLTNAAQFQCPVTAIQFVDRPNVKINRTTSDSMVLLSTDAALFVMRTSELEDQFGHKGDQLNKPSYLWNLDAVEKGQEQERRAKRLKLDMLQGYACGTAEEAYHTIVRRCSEAGGDATITVQQLWQTIPRPSSQAASSVGTMFGEGSNAEPPTRRGEIRRRGADRRG
ncbi:hypothetical protein LTR37_017075 [Vermiconidia calcicola]|uniref:Uncharacterized protein n=1 Tax=Vermiconidia calcicola TaxID=1690605 RepID=A0ACC3MMI1_9PEZI|nr:hypothetical protein LTR37_017075 [Vermiconidia calcicola]